jgi:hypothetical protein
MWLNLPDHHGWQHIGGDAVGINSCDWLVEHILVPGLLLTWCAVTMCMLLLLASLRKQSAIGPQL